MRVLIVLLIFLFLTSTRLWAQDADTVSVVQQHSPGRAVIYSAVLPGLGQAYNKKYWKIPIVYAGLGISLYAAKFNNDRYQQYREALVIRNDTNSIIVDDFIDIYSNEDLIVLKDAYRRNRDLSWIIASAVYLLNIMDAYVDAHLFYFDVSDDLGLKISPLLPDNSFASAKGISINLYFK